MPVDYTKPGASRPQPATPPAPTEKEKSDWYSGTERGQRGIPPVSSGGSSFILPANATAADVAAVPTGNTQTGWRYGYPMPASWRGLSPYEQVASGQGPIGLGFQRVGITAQYNNAGLELAISEYQRTQNAEAYKSAYREESNKALENLSTEKKTEIYQQSAIADLSQEGLISIERRTRTEKEQEEYRSYMKEKGKYATEEDIKYEPYIRLTEKGQALGLENLYGLEEGAIWGKAFDFVPSSSRGNVLIMVPQGTRATMKELGIDQPFALEKGGDQYLISGSGGTGSITVQKIDPFSYSLGEKQQMPLSDFVEIPSNYELTPSTQYSYSLSDKGVDVNVSGLTSTGPAFMSKEWYQLNPWVDKPKEQATSQETTTGISFRAARSVHKDLELNSPKLTGFAGYVQEQDNLLYSYNTILSDLENVGNASRSAAKQYLPGWAQEGTIGIVTSHLVEFGSGGLEAIGTTPSLVMKLAIRSPVGGLAYIARGESNPLESMGGFYISSGWETFTGIGMAASGAFGKAAGGDVSAVTMPAARIGGGLFVVTGLSGGLISPQDRVLLMNDNDRVALLEKLKASHELQRKAMVSDLMANGGGPSFGSIQAIPKWLSEKITTRLALSGRMEADLDWAPSMAPPKVTYEIEGYEVVAIPVASGTQFGAPVYVRQMQVVGALPNQASGLASIFAFSSIAANKSLVPQLSVTNIADTRVGYEMAPPLQQNSLYSTSLRNTLRTQNLLVPERLSPTINMPRQLNLQINMTLTPQKTIIRNVEVPRQLQIQRQMLVTIQPPRIITPKMLGLKISFDYGQQKRPNKDSKVKLLDVRGYNPSVAGVDLGLTVKKAKKAYSGLEIRGLLSGKRRKDIELL